MANALDAEGAFLHHTATTDCHIGIELVLQSGQFRALARIRIIPPVEDTHLIRTVVGAITGADTAVIDLQVNVFRERCGPKRTQDKPARKALYDIAGTSPVDKESS